MHLDPKAKDPYLQKVSKNKQKLANKLGDGKVLAEDDYIRPEDFVDHAKREKLRDKGFKNASIEKRKASDGGKHHTPDTRKPSIANSANKSIARRSAGRRSRESRRSDDDGRPISRELDRQSNQSDPYKIM